MGGAYIGHTARKQQNQCFVCPPGCLFLQAWDTRQLGHVRRLVLGWVCSMAILQYWGISSSVTSHPDTGRQLLLKFPYYR